MKKNINRYILDELISDINNLDKDINDIKKRIDKKKEYLYKLAVIYNNLV